MYKPLLDNLVIKKIQPEKITKSGIILTEETDPANTAEVIAIGEQITDIAIGNMVMFCPYAGEELSEGLTQINYNDVIGILL